MARKSLQSGPQSPNLHIFGMIFNGQGFMGTPNKMFHVPNFNFNCTKYLFRKNTKLIILEPNKIIEHLKNKYEVNQIIY